MINKKTVKLPLSLEMTLLIKISIPPERADINDIIQNNKLFLLPILSSVKIFN